MLHLLWAILNFVAAEIHEVEVKFRDNVGESVSKAGYSDTSLFRYKL